MPSTTSRRRSLSGHRAAAPSSGAHGRGGGEARSGDAAGNGLGGAGGTTGSGTAGESTGWAEPTPRAFPYAPPVTIHAGETITYSCEYVNTTANTYVQGVSAATNEMCILHGMYWPRTDQKTEMCLGGVDPTAAAGKATTDAGADGEAR